MGLYGSEAWLIFKQWQVQMFMQEIDGPDPFGENLPAGNIQDTANYNWKKRLKKLYIVSFDN